MQQLPTAPRSGQQVDVRGEPWLVVDVDVHQAATLLTLRGVGNHNRGEVTRLLTPFDRVHAIGAQSRLRHRTRRRVLEHVRMVAATAIPWTACRAALAARLDHREWQRAPALAMINGATRVLLADAVGLGKTIQALIAVAELESRGLVRRVLILTPAALREQWAAEMSRRFAMRATIFDHVSLAATLAQQPIDSNPWNTASPIVTSIDLVKRPEVRQSLDRAAFDLVIVDEAHHLTPGSDRAAVVADLASRTPFCLLATATPHSGDAAAYRFLCDLGRCAGAEEIQIFRRAASDVQLARSRRTRIVAIAPSAAERALLDATLAYARALWSGPGGTSAQLVASVIARRACSWPGAACRTLERRLASLRGTPDGDDQPRLPWDEDMPDDEVPEAVVGVAGLLDRAAEVEWVTRLAHLAAAAATTPSKLSYLRRLLGRTRESVLVFSEYRDAAVAVAAALEDVSSVAALHGGLSPGVRRELVTLFTRGQIRTLVTTDAAGEGLNLQTRCRLVVTLELPWNPLRLEQRIGRVDRLGQTRRVHSRHLVHRGSYEDVVLGRLERRRQSASIALGDAVLTEQAIATAVMTSEPLAEDRLPHSLPALSAPLAAVTMAERQGETSPSGRLAHASYSSTPPRQRPARAVTLVFAADIFDAAGRALQAELVGVQVVFDPASAVRRLSRRVIKALTTRARIATTVREALQRRVPTAVATVSPAAMRLQARLDALVAELSTRQRQVWVQGSLFDTRAHQHAQAVAAVVAQWREHLDRHAVSARALTALDVGAPRLVAAWLDDEVR